MGENKPKLILITGGVRSGKSFFAEKLAKNFGEKIVFIATAQALDEEMNEKIKQHRAKRPIQWKTFEEPYHVEKIIQEVGGSVEVILIDCLTLLVSNLMKEYSEDNSQKYLMNRIIQKIEEVILESFRCKATVIMVSNEVGLGLVPNNPMGRFFRDILGKINQLIAIKCDLVYFMVAGIPLLIKGKSDEVYF